MNQGESGGECSMHRRGITCRKETIWENKEKLLMLKEIGHERVERVG
jgi:hypothetical protein